MVKMKHILIAVGVAAIGAGLIYSPQIAGYFGEERAARQQQADLKDGRVTIAKDGVEKDLAVATFAGGCFWCVEDKFDHVPGVWAAVSGYSGGDEKNPTYWQVASGTTGHTESVQVYYDPKVITYDGLLQAFWRIMDPTDLGGQFSDRGKQYRPVIFYHTEAQRIAAENSKEALDKSHRYDKPVVIPIEPYKNFYLAENYHQDYSRENPLHYRMYTHGSGRAPFVEEIWGDDLELDYSTFRPKAEDGAMKTSEVKGE